MPIVYELVSSEISKGLLPLLFKVAAKLNLLVN